MVGGLGVWGIDVALWNIGVMGRGFNGRILRVFSFVRPFEKNIPSTGAKKYVWQKEETGTRKPEEKRNIFSLLVFV